MRKNADNLKISHRQLLSLALQGVPFALMNVFQKKKTYHKHFHKLHWHESFHSLEFVTETKPLAINSDYWKFLASKILYFSPEKHSTQWLRPVLPMFSLRWFMLIIRKINQKLTWTWTARKIFIPQDFISIKKNGVLIREALSFAFIWKTTQIFLLYPLNRVILCYLSHQNTQYLICGKHILI